MCLFPSKGESVSLNLFNVIWDKSQQHINGMAQIKLAKYGVVDMDFVLGIGGYDLDRSGLLFALQLIPEGFMSIMLRCLKLMSHKPDVNHVSLAELNLKLSQMILIVLMNMMLAMVLFCFCIFCSLFLTVPFALIIYSMLSKWKLS